MLRIFIIMIFCTSYLFSVEEFSNPLNPGKEKNTVSIGISDGINYLIGPTILKEIPNQGNVLTQQSLLNNLNGLGYKFAPNYGLTLRFPISGRFWLATNLNYSSFTSQNKCNCSSTVLLYNSENKLNNIQIAVLPFFYFASVNKTIFYIAPEINMNIFKVSVKESGSQRNAMDFSKIYPRLGLGLTLGSEIHFIENLAIDLNLKGQALNLLLTKYNSRLTYTGVSESLINKIGDTKEALITLFQLNIGLLYSL